MSDSIVSISKSYWNGELVGAVNSQYRELINIDPEAVPYIDKLSPTSFFAKTRKGYVGSVIPSIGDLSDYGAMQNVTDVIKIDTTGCGGGECYRLYYQVSEDRSSFRVVRRNCDVCDSLTIVQEGYRCPCDSDKFFRLDYPIGEVIMEGLGQQEVINIVDHRFNNTDIVAPADFEYATFSGQVPGMSTNVVITASNIGEIGNNISLYFDGTNTINESILERNTAYPLNQCSLTSGDGTQIPNNGEDIDLSGGLGTVQVGDYIVFYHTSDSLNPGLCGIYRQITGVFTDYITIDGTYAPIDGDNRIGDNVGFKIFRDYGPTAGWVGNMSINIYSGSSNVTTTMCGARGGCLVSVVNHNGIINVLTEQGYNSYGGIGEDILFFQGLNTVYVGTDKFTSVSFGDFLVTMGNHSIVAIVFDQNGQYAYKYDLTSASYDDFGIYSRNAYAVFANSLYIVGIDKRLYMVSIEGNANKYYLKLNPQSDAIFTDLDLLQDGDEASISSYQNKLYIFINGRFDVDDSYTNKTKILIFNGDYKLWYKHIVPWGVLIGTKYGLFYGDGIFQYVGDRDIYQFGDDYNQYHKSAPIKAEIIFDIVNSENHGITNGLGNRVSLMTNKAINRIKLLLGPGVYTDNTYIDIVSYMSGYKFTKRITGIDNEWIDNRKEYFAGNYAGITVSDCFAEMLSKCDNMDNPCEGSSANTDVREQLESPICWENSPETDVVFESHRFDDYAICYDDRAYQLSPLKHIYINPQMKYNATLYTIKIVSDNFDKMNFGGAVVEYESYPIGYREKTSFDLEPECCKTEPNCPTQDCP